MSPVLNILTYFASAFYNFQYMLEVRPPDKNACLHFSVFLNQNILSSVLKGRTLSLRSFFTETVLLSSQPTHIFILMGKKCNTLFYTQTFCLSGPIIS